MNADNPRDPFSDNVIIRGKIFKFKQLKSVNYEILKIVLRES